MWAHEYRWRVATAAVVTMVVITIIVVACATTPLGRRQLRLFPGSMLTELGEQAFSQIERATPRVEDPTLTRYVTCVASTITRSLDSADWEIVLFDDESVNAFALPGRKVGVYRGMLDVAGNQDELATVIAHEVAHVLAEHANERLSTEYLVRIGFDAIRGRVSTSPGVLAALGLGVQVGILLPYSRVQEQEADLYGLRLMARAGFDPAAAVVLWQRMSEQSEHEVPELLSTHPADESRILYIEEQLPEADAIYQEALRAGNRTICE